MAAPSAGRCHWTAGGHSIDCLRDVGFDGICPRLCRVYSTATWPISGPLPLIGLLFQGPPIGIGLLCAGIILAIMIIPYIASVMCEVFALTPVMLKESAYGIGCTTWEVMRYVVLPYTQSGVMGGVILGLGRALGETMAVTFVIGNSNALNDLSLFSPGNSITSMLANA